MASGHNMKFTKTATEYDMKSIRFLLLTITTMFIIIAGLMIVLGMSVYSHYHSFTFLYESARSGRFFTPSILSVLLGLFLLIVTLFGFFGSLKQSTCMVNTYALMLSVILIIKLAIVILAFTTEYETIAKYMYIPIREYVNDPEIQDEIDNMQISLNCCGGDSYLDYVGMQFNSNHSTVVVSNEADDGDFVTMVVPESCCASSGQTTCTRVRTTGCKSALVNLVVQNATVIGVLGVSVMFVQLLGIIFALLLARCIRKLKSERVFMAWKIREQMIFARQAEEAHKDSNQTVYIVKPDSSIA